MERSVNNTAWQESPSDALAVMVIMSLLKDTPDKTGAAGRFTA